MAVLQLRVEVPESGKQDCITYLDFDFVRSNNSLLQHVQQLAWDILPSAEEIKATYLDDDGDVCTLTDRTSGDALSFASAQDAEGNRILNISVCGVCPQTQAPDNQAEQSPLHVADQEQEDTSLADNCDISEGYECDGCKRGPIVGHRFHSLEWENFDLCGDCHGLQPTDRFNVFGALPDHKFEAVASAGAAPIARPDASESAGPASSPDASSREQPSLLSESSAIVDAAIDNAVKMLLAPAPESLPCKKPRISFSTLATTSVVEDGNHVFKPSSTEERQLSPRIDSSLNSGASQGSTVPICFFGKSVLITSHRNQNLQDNNSNVRLHTNIQGWEQWTIIDAGNSRVFIKSHRNHNLQDNYGHVKLHTNSQGWEQWTISDAGDGKVFIKSHRNQNLQDIDGSVKMGSNTGSWEQWTIRDTSGIPVEFAAASQAAVDVASLAPSADVRAACSLAPAAASPAVAKALSEAEGQTCTAAVHAMAKSGTEEQHQQQVRQSLDVAESCAAAADNARKETIEAKQSAHDQVQKIKEESQRVVEQAQEDLKCKTLHFEDYIQQTNEHKRELTEERDELKHLFKEAAVESVSCKQQTKKVMQSMVEMEVQLARYQNNAEEDAQRVLEIEAECVRCGTEVVRIETECTSYKEEVKKLEQQALQAQKSSNESEEAKQKAEEITEELQQRCLDLQIANKVEQQKAGQFAEELQQSVEQQIGVLATKLASMEARALAAEKTAHEAQQVKGSAGLSAIVQGCSSLTLGIEAEEVAGVRGDVTCEFSELVSSCKARQAFCIGRVCLATSIGRQSPSVPACLKVMLQNDGTVVWPQTTAVVNVQGPDMGLPIMALGAMQPGEVAEIEMDLELPSKPEACSETRSSWAIIDAATGAQLGPLLIFEAAWSSPE